MARCKKCGGAGRIQSNTVKNMLNGCVDVCVNPICESPDMLGIMAPVIYDEIGINLCATFALGAEIPTAYPTAVCATAQVVNVTYAVGGEGVTVEPISGRPNCYLVSLTTLTVTFAINLYDCCYRLLGTVYTDAVYLPPETGETYDEDTNPTLVQLEIFAPYGISYTVTGEADLTATLNYIGFATTANYVTQGINMYAIPKVLNLNTEDSEITIGLTVMVQSLYFAGYNVKSEGKINTPKGTLATQDDSACLRFVAGDLLNLEIKPLELGFPRCEENLKDECSQCNQCACNQIIAEIE